MEFASLVENTMIFEGVFCAVSDTGLGIANRSKCEQDCYCLKIGPHKLGIKQNRNIIMEIFAKFYITSSCFISLSK